MLRAPRSRSDCPTSELAVATFPQNEGALDSPETARNATRQASGFLALMRTQPRPAGWGYILPDESCPEERVGLFSCQACTTPGVTHGHENDQDRRLRPCAPRLSVEARLVSEPALKGVNIQISNINRVSHLRRRSPPSARKGAEETIQASEYVTLRGTLLLTLRHSLAPRPYFRGNDL